MRQQSVPQNYQSTFIQFSGTSSPDAAPAGSARIWWDEANAALKFSVNGSAFTNNPGALRLRDLTEQILVAAPAASAAAALMRFDNGATPFVGSANGTFLGINAAAGFTGNLLDLQANASARLSVTATGILTTLKAIVGGTTSLGTASLFATDAATSALVVQQAASPTAAPFIVQTSVPATVAQISTAGHGAFGHAAAPASALHAVKTAIEQLRVQGTAGGGGIMLLNQAASGKTNWFLGCQNNVNNGLEVTASTAVDGTTFSTPTLTLLSQQLGVNSTTALAAALGVEAATDRRAAIFRAFATPTTNFVEVQANDGTIKLAVGNTAITVGDAVNFVLNATTGSKIGTATSQKLGFFNATPVVQQSAGTAATDAASTQTLANQLRTSLIALGLVA